MRGEDASAYVFPPTPSFPRPKEELSWMSDAACTGLDALFFSKNEEKRDEAKRICLYRCPVQSQCAAYRLRVEPTDGVWAGKGPIRDYEREERRQRQRQQPASAQIGP